MYHILYVYYVFMLAIQLVIECKCTNDWYFRFLSGLRTSSEAEKLKYKPNTNTKCWLVFRKLVVDFRNVILKSYWIDRNLEFSRIIVSINYHGVCSWGHVRRTFFRIGNLRKNAFPFCLDAYTETRKNCFVVLLRNLLSYKLFYHFLHQIFEELSAGEKKNSNQNLRQTTIFQ